MNAKAVEQLKRVLQANIEALKIELKLDGIYICAARRVGNECHMVDAVNWPRDGSIPPIEKLLRYSADDLEVAD